MDSFVILYISFVKNFEGKEESLNKFLPTFSKIADKLKELRIKDAFVDVSFKKDLVDFNIILDNGLFLSVASNIDNSSDEVMYSIAKNHQTISIGIIDIGDIICEIRKAGL